MMRMIVHQKVIFSFFGFNLFSLFSFLSTLHSISTVRMFGGRIHIVEHKHSAWFILDTNQSIKLANISQSFARFICYGYRFESHLWVHINGHISIAAHRYWQHWTAFITAIVINALFSNQFNKSGFTLCGQFSDNRFNIDIVSMENSTQFIHVPVHWQLWRTTVDVLFWKNFAPYQCFPVS